MTRVKRKSQTQKLRRRQRHAAGLAKPRVAKTAPTSRARYEVKINGSWVPARDRGHKPRIGGAVVTMYRFFGRITDVREAKS